MTQYKHTQHAQSNTITLRDYHGSEKPVQVAGMGLLGMGQGCHSQPVPNPYPWHGYPRVKPHIYLQPYMHLSSSYSTNTIPHIAECSRSLPMEPLWPFPGSPFITGVMCHPLLPPAVQRKQICATAKAAASSGAIPVHYSPVLPLVQVVHQDFAPYRHCSGACLLH